MIIKNLRYQLLTLDWTYFGWFKLDVPSAELQSLPFFIQLYLTNILPMKLSIQLDIGIINNPKAFQAELRYNTLLGALVFGREQSSGDAQQLRQAISAQLFKVQFKSVYVAMKWLIFFHQCLNLVKTGNHSFTVIQILNFLSQIQQPKTQSKHQEYLLKKLYITYLQYLIKLASAIQITCQTFSSPESYIFLEFNLLRFAIAEFTHPISEFNPYFKQCYPHLSKCFSLISKQIQTLYKQVTLHYELKHLQQMHFIEVDQLSQSVVFFHTQKQNNQKNNSALATHDGTKHNVSPFEQKAIADFMGVECTQLTLNS